MNRKIIEFKQVTKRYGSELIFEHLDLVFYQNEFVTLLGPSGSGKTTLLKLIAGFENVDAGQIVVNQILVNHLPPNQRSVNTVFQDYALFPHMSVYQNIAFGLKMKRQSQVQIDKSVQEALKMIRMEQFRDRKPHQLSGGQQQRVALARAIVNKPLVLLLDEPLSALDESLRQQMQTELKQMQRTLGITFVLVTHDQEEALSISDRVVVVNEGRIEQCGTPQEIYESPANHFVANFVGELNEIEAWVEHSDSHQPLVVNVEHQCIMSLACGTQKAYTPGELIKLYIRPEHFKLRLLSTDPLASGQTQALSGVIAEIGYKGAMVDYWVILDSGKKILVTLFHSKEAQLDQYRGGMRIALEWIPGQEMMLCA
jgi:spermidine/putrescine transport system ATP-binding protein